jgi:hypothetical protein
LLPPIRSDSRCHGTALRRGSDVAANEPAIDLKGRQVENRLEVSDGPCLDLAQNPEEARPTVALHVFKRRSSVNGSPPLGSFIHCLDTEGDKQRSRAVRIRATITIRATTSSETLIASADKSSRTVASSTPIKEPASEKSSSYDVKASRKLSIVRDLQLS